MRRLRKNYSRDHFRSAQNRADAMRKFDQVFKTTDERIQAKKASKINKKP